MMGRLNLAVALFAFSLAGCETLGSIWGDDEPAVGCPTAAILAETASVTKFRAGGDGPENTILSATMGRPSITCSYDADARRATASVTIPITVMRGGAGGQAALDYFVAVVDGPGNLSKQVHRLQADTARSASFVMSEDVNNITFNVAQDSTPASYQVLVGFQLTPQELAHNRARQTSRP